METLNCHTEIEVDRVHFLRFCTKYDTRFSKYGIELIVSLSSTNATKTTAVTKCDSIPRQGFDRNQFFVHKQMDTVSGYI